MYGPWTKKGYFCEMSRKSAVAPSRLVVGLVPQDRVELSPGQKAGRSEYFPLAIGQLNPPHHSASSRPPGPVKLSLAPHPSCQSTYKKFGPRGCELFFFLSSQHFPRPKNRHRSYHRGTSSIPRSSSALGESPRTSLVLLEVSGNAPP